MGEGFLLNLINNASTSMPTAGDGFHFIAADEGTKSHHVLTVSW